MIKIKNKILTALLGAFMVVGGISVVSGNKAVESRATATSDTYEKYTSALVEGDYLLTYTTKSTTYAMKSVVSSDRLSYSIVTIDSDKISEPDSTLVWHLASSGDYWTIYNADVKKYAASTGVKSKAQLLDSGTDDKSLWSVTFSNSTFDFTNKQNKSMDVNSTLRNNTTYGFACYSTSTGGALTLFKKVEAQTGNLESISLGGDYKTSYSKHDAFIFDATVTANFDDGSSLIVQATNVSSPDMTTTGEKEVTVSYTSGSVTKTASYTITVSDYVFDGQGTLLDPYSTKDAIYVAKDGGTTENVYVKGKVLNSYAPSLTDNTYYKNLYLTENGATDSFTLFTCYADENKTAFSGNIVAKNDDVIACGKITTYTNSETGSITYELDSGCYLVNYKTTGISLSSNEVTKSFNVGGKPSISELGITITSTLENGDTEDVTSDATISWSGENENGLVKGDNTLTITYTQTNKYSGKAFVSGGTASTTVVVKNVIQPVTSIKIDNEITEINLNEPVTLTATVSPDDANDKTITWSSSDETIATVTDAGVVTGVATGKVTITAKSGDMSDSIELVVKDPNFVISTLVLSGERDYFVGEDFDKSFYTATGVYNDDATELDVTDDVTWDLTNYNKDAAGTYKVSVNYVNSKNESITESVDVNVVEKVLSYIVCDEGDMKTSYTTDDTEVDLTGINVLAVYKDAKRDTKVTENLNVVKQPDFTTIGSHDVTVSYTDNGITKEDTVTISVSLAKMVLKNSNPDKYEKVTADRDDWSGTYVLTYDDKYAFNGLNTSNNYYDVSISNDSITSSSVQTTLTIAKYENGYSIKMNGGDNDGKYISGTAGSNALNLNDSALENTISFVDGNVDIASNTSHLRVYYAYSSKTSTTTLNFKYYKESSFASQKAVQLYRLNDEFAVTEDMYNMVLAADKALVCGTSENGWNGTYDIDTVKENIELLSDAELTALKNAKANQGGNIVEKFLWKYDYLISAGKITDNFLNRNVASAAKVSPIFNNINNDTTIAIIVIISLISVSSIAGFLFLKKRKEQ